MATVSGNSRGYISLIGPIGAGVALVVGLIALVIGFSASGSASGNEDVLVAVQAELTRTKGELATTGESLRSLDGAFKQAQTALSDAQAAVQSTLDSLGDGQKGVKDSLGAVERELSDARDNISAQADTIRDVDRSLDALKNSFTLTRDDVAANKNSMILNGQEITDLQSTQVQNKKVEKFLVATAILEMWFGTLSDAALAAATRPLAKNAVVATGDSELKDSWDILEAAVDVFNADSSQANADTTNAAADAFAALLAEKIANSTQSTG